MTLPGLEEKYEILQVLGEGGMGIVYKALQKPLNRPVAMKVIAPHLARNPQIRERFANEAVVLARLNHPNIVTLYDFVQTSDALYIIMEFLEGKPLYELTQAGPLPLSQVKDYFCQVLEAFAYAHRHGIVHRDIKPSNIMITAEGRVKVLDFGIARLLQSDHGLTRTGARVGTLLYMSPEQVKGEKNVDARSDIYSLGVVLYEMLSGSPPYPVDMSEFDMSLKIVNEPIFDLSAPPAHIPVPLIEVILRATEKIPAHRYESCEAFLRDFTKALESPEKVSLIPPVMQEKGVAEKRGEPSLSQRAVSPSHKPQRRKVVLVAMAAGVALVSAGIGWYWIKKQNKSSSVESVQKTPIPSGDTLTLTVKSLPTPPPAPKESMPVPATPSTPPPPKAAILTPPRPKPTSPARPSASATPASPSPTSHPAPSTAKPDIHAEIRNFQRGALLSQKVSATLFLRNKGEAAASNIRVEVRLLSREGSPKLVDTIYIATLSQGEDFSYPIQYKASGIQKVEAKVLDFRY
ncbi:MAG: protein kinase [Bacteroidia bacterium]|nr:protein kinase [Bacteroidia bacterium]MDW8235264.1 protein kinase [Bacteroidia bacterium]